MTGVEIRGARPDDIDDIAGFASDTWDGWDYVPDVWDDWLDEGDTVVAEADDGAVGVVHTVVRDGEAWLEGMRVHPDHRRGGVASSLAREALDRLGDDVTVARCMAFDGNGPALSLLDSLGFERAATVRHGRGFGFPYGTKLEGANYDDSLDALRDTDAFESFGGLYATTDWHMWSVPETADGYDGEILGFVEDGDVRAIVLCDGVRVNTTGEEKRTELVFGLVWCEPEYASQFALDVRGEARDRNINDALVFLPDDEDYTASFERSGYDLSDRRDHVYRKVIR